MAPEDRTSDGPMLTRRDFLKISTASTAALLTGCAVNPVTGHNQFMLMSEGAERDVDKQWSPHQFSADYGAVQETGLSEYVSEIGRAMVPVTHRPNMPYNWRVLNSVDVNAYTFPAGSMGFTRALMLTLENEAELAAVMGHELVHVGARHAAQSQTTGLVAQMLVAGVTLYVESEAEDYAWVAAGLGMLGTNALLCRYSRDNEREADKFGIRYMAKGGYDPKGMVGVMDKFRKLQKDKPNVIETLFATHPMSQDRYDDAVRRAGELGPTVQNPKTNRERYMDRTSRLRAIKIPIEEMQKAGHLMGKSQFADADVHLLAALRTVPQDYAALLMMAKNCLAQKKNDLARKYAEDAKTAYPAEPQARHVAGMAKTGLRLYPAALQEFSAYEAKLPGNPNSAYYKGFCLDKMGRKEEAGREYSKYLENAPGGEHAGVVKQRMTDWGLRQPEPAPETQPAPKTKAQPAAAQKATAKPTTKK